MTDIKIDSSTMQELQSRGITAQTGVYGEHMVQLGTSKPIRLDSIKGNYIPFQGFNTVTKQERGLKGLSDCVSNALKILTRPEGKFDAKGLLSSLKTAQEYEQRLTNLDTKNIDEERHSRLDSEYNHILSELDARILSERDRNERVRLADEIKKTLAEYGAKKEELIHHKQKSISLAGTVPIKNLSNNALASIYQTFTSGEMDVLQTALLMEGRNHVESKDARALASALFDLQAQILKEVSDRAVVGMLEDQSVKEADGRLRDALQARKEQIQSELEYIQSRENITSANALTLVETAAQSATTREKTVEEQTQRLAARNLTSVSVREMADVMRQAELTINISPEILFADGGVIDDPASPMKNIFHLAEQNILPKGVEYLIERDVVERVLFPELLGHGVKSDERPIYGALNIAHNVTGAAERVYGSAVIVLKPEVANRATYIAEDTFYSPAVSITPERRQNFYNLLDGAGLSSTLVAKCKAEGSKEHQDLEQWFDKIAGSPEADLRYFKDFPQALGFGSEMEKSLFKALLVRCFGDAESTRKIMATRDNLEALIPHMSNYNGNALANAAIKAKSGDPNPKAVLSCLNYVEAQIQGSLVPARDIAEIRIITDKNLDEDQLNRLSVFERQTGVKVSLISDPPNNSISISTQDALNRDNVMTAQDKFNLSHLDSGQIDKLIDEYVRDFGQKLGVFISQEPRLADVAKELVIGGRALSDYKNRFTSEVARLKKDPNWASKDPEELVQMAFEKIVRPLLDKKAEIIRAVNGLKFENPQAQRAAFIRWVCDAAVLNSVQEMRIVHEFATLQASFLKQVYSSDPPMSDKEIVSGMADIVRKADPQLKEYIASLNNPASDDRVTMLNRISSMSETLLRETEPPTTEEQLRTLYDRINSPQMKAMRAQLHEIGNRNAQDGISQVADFTMFQDVITLWSFNARNIGNVAGVDVNSPTDLDFKAEMSLLGDKVRGLVQDIAPQVARAFEQAYPKYDAFPPASKPAALPSDGKGRRDFLIKHLDNYMKHEETFDTFFTHGRGHVVRAFIYGSVMCSILEEQGIAMDRNAVMCGITQHDSGRQNNGTDYWEEDSAKNAVEAMREDFGEDSLGEEYEKEVKKCIAGHQGKTVEAMLLNAADSLDIGRTRDFDPNSFVFLLGKGEEQPTMQAQKLREQLIVEADLLQRLTNPYCSARNAYNRLRIAAGDDARNAEYYQAQRIELGQAIRTDLEKEWEVAAADYVQKYESIITSNPQLFPLFSRYYQG